MEKKNAEISIFTEIRSYLRKFLKSMKHKGNEALLYLIIIDSVKSLQQSLYYDNN